MFLACLVPVGPRVVRGRVRLAGMTMPQRVRKLLFTWRSSGVPVECSSEPCYLKASVYKYREDALSWRESKVGATVGRRTRRQCRTTDGLSVAHELLRS